MNKHVNAQYNLAAPESLPVRVAARVRRCMFEAFMAEFEPSGSDTVLDIGATSDQTYIHSNYFEAYYPFKNQITAAGIDDASFLQTLYPGVRFVFANALHLPFSTGAFDLVHSSAVLEHVGSSKNQFRMIFIPAGCPSRHFSDDSKPMVSNRVSHAAPAVPLVADAGLSGQLSGDGLWFLRKRRQSQSHDAGAPANGPQPDFRAGSLGSSQHAVAVMALIPSRLGRAASPSEIALIE
jgi:hypothetical protein